MSLCILHLQLIPHDVSHFRASFSFFMAKISMEILEKHQDVNRKCVLWNPSMIQWSRINTSTNIVYFEKRAIDGFGTTSL